MTTHDPYNLNRFVAAQDSDGTYDSALEELQRGRKTSHWMWFVFPQLAGLGHTATSKLFAISSLEEARAFLDHPVLGPRLIQCADAICRLQERSAQQILGTVDAQKLRSSMTLFLRASSDEPHFERVLQRYFDGQPDPATDHLLIT